MKVNAMSNLYSTNMYVCVIFLVAQEISLIEKQ